MIRGLERFSGRYYLVICLGLLGKWLKSTANNYKIKIDIVVNVIGSNGIQLFDPPIFYTNNNSGIAWDFQSFTNSSKQILTPTTGIIYQHRNNTVARFGQYHSQQLVSSDFGNENEEIDEELNVCSFRLCDRTPWLSVCLHN